MGKILDFTINMSMLMSGNFTGAVTPAIQAASQLQQKLSDLSSAGTKLQKLQQSREKLLTLRESLAKAQLHVKTLGVEMRRTDQPSKQMRQSFTKANIDASRLQEAVQKQMKSIAQLGTSLREAGVDTSRLGSEEVRLKGEIDRVTQSQERLNAAQGKYGRLRESLNWENIKGGIMGSTAAIAAFQKPIKIDMEFEQAMANVRAVAAPTPEQFTALRAQALELGSATQYTSTQSAQAQEVLMRAGLKADEVLKVLPNILQTAGAEGMEISQAADILINVTKNMNLPIEELGRVADVMAYTSAHSNTNIAQLGEAALKAAGPFSSMGGTVEELMSTLGAMSNTVRGAEAGTALAGVARRLGKDPKAVSQELSRYGIKTRDRQGNFAPFAEIIAQVELQANKLGTKTAAGLRGNIYGMFGSQMQGFGRTLQNGEYKSLLTGTQTESAGSAERMNKTRNDTLKGDITSLGSAWEGLMIRIGSALDPINRFITKTLTEGIQKLNEWIDQHKDWVDLIIQAGYALGGMMIVRQVWRYASLAYQTFKAWVEVKSATAAVEELSGALNGAAQGAGLFGLSLGKALGTLGLIAGACYLIYTYWDDITGAAERAGQAISNIPRDVPVSQLPQGSAERAVRVMEMGYMPPEIPAHAFGGILSTPHVGLVAEAGPEAIIPLTDRSRGIPLVMQAANILGLGQVRTPSTTSSSIKELTDNVRQYSPSNNYSIERSNTNNSVVDRQSPVINITVNGAGQDEQSIADKIARAVSEALRNISSIEERVSYA